MWQNMWLHCYMWHSHSGRTNCTLFKIIVLEHFFEPSSIVNKTQICLELFILVWDFLRPFRLKTNPGSTNHINMVSWTDYRSELAKLQWWWTVIMKRIANGLITEISTVVSPAVRLAVLTGPRSVKIIKFKNRRESSKSVWHACNA